MTKTTPWTYRQVQLEVQRKGLQAVKDAYKNGIVSKRTLARAVNTSREENEDCDELEKWCMNELAMFHGRGRPSPSVGETRTYKAQQVGKRPVFGRTPLEHLGIKKNGAVKMTFEEGRIIVESAA